MSKDKRRPIMDDIFTWGSMEDGIFVDGTDEDIDMDLDEAAFSIILATQNWRPFEGARGGRGWQHVSSGEVRYQQEMPTDGGGEQQQPKPQQHQSYSEEVEQTIGAFYNPDAEWYKMTDEDIEGWSEKLAAVPDVSIWSIIQKTFDDFDEARENNDNKAYMNNNKKIRALRASMKLRPVGPKVNLDSENWSQAIVVDLSEDQMDKEHRQESLDHIKCLPRVPLLAGGNAAMFVVPEGLNSSQIGDLFGAEVQFLDNEEAGGPASETADWLWDKVVGQEQIPVENVPAQARYGEEVEHEPFDPEDVERYKRVGKDLYLVRRPGEDTHYETKKHVPELVAIDRKWLDEPSGEGETRLKPTRREAGLKAREKRRSQDPEYQHVVDTMNDINNIDGEMVMYHRRKHPDMPVEHIQAKMAEGFSKYNEEKGRPYRYKLDKKTGKYEIFHIGETRLSLDDDISFDEFQSIIDAPFAYDIENRKAQGILNRALDAARKLSSKARDELSDAFDRDTPAAAATQVVSFINRYRDQMADVLSSTQLAALLEGAREVARHLPPLPPAGTAVPPPPTLPPDEARDMVNRLRDLPVWLREEEIYLLPADQQEYIKQALRLEPQTPVIPPETVLPPAPSASSFGVQFPILEAAARELSQKYIVTRPVYDRLEQAAKQKAFTVTGVDARDTLEKIRNALSENITEGVDLESFRKKVLAAVDHGTFLSDAHLETVFRNNIQAAFSDGQMGVLKHPFVRKGFPYAGYHAIHDDRVRHNHLALEKHGIDGTNVYRIDDPVFQTFRPPWDWSDRCSWIPMTIKMAAEQGLKEALQWIDSGAEPSPPAYVPMPPFEPPPGFKRTISAAPMAVQLSLEPMEGIDAAFAERPHSPSATGRIVNGRFYKPGQFLPDEVPSDALQKSLEAMDLWEEPKDEDVKEEEEACQDFIEKPPASNPCLWHGSECPGPGWLMIAEATWAQILVAQPIQEECADEDIDEAEFSIILSAEDWRPFEGARGGRGWQHLQTGEVRYQQERPSGDGGAEPEEQDPRRESADERGILFDWLSGDVDSEDFSWESISDKEFSAISQGLAKKPADLFEAYLAKRKLDGYGYEEADEMGANIVDEIIDNAIALVKPGVPYDISKETLEKSAIMGIEDADEESLQMLSKFAKMIPRGKSFGSKKAFLVMPPEGMGMGEFSEAVYDMSSGNITLEWSMSDDGMAALYDGSVAPEQMAIEDLPPEAGRDPHMIEDDIEFDADTVTTYRRLNKLLWISKEPDGEGGFTNRYVGVKYKPETINAPEHILERRGGTDVKERLGEDEAAELAREKRAARQTRQEEKLEARRARRKERREDITEAELSIILRERR